MALNKLRRDFERKGQALMVVPLFTFLSCISGGELKVVRQLNTTLSTYPTARIEVSSTNLDSQSTTRFTHFLAMRLQAENLFQKVFEPIDKDTQSTFVIHLVIQKKTNWASELAEDPPVYLETTLSALDKESKELAVLEVKGNSLYQPERKELVKDTGYAKSGRISFARYEDHQYEFMQKAIEESVSRIVTYFKERK